MKMLFRYMLALAVGVMSICGVSADAPTAEISFARQVVDLGVLSHSDDKQVVAVEYTNTGDVPLVVLEVRTTCSCTTVKYERKKLLPKESAYLTIVMDPSKAPVGNFYRVLQVVSTAKTKVNNITLKAVIQ